MIPELGWSNSFKFRRVAVCQRIRAWKRLCFWLIWLYQLLQRLLKRLLMVLHCLCSLGDPLIELFRCQRHIQASKWQCFWLRLLMRLLTVFIACVLFFMLCLSCFGGVITVSELWSYNIFGSDGFVSYYCGCWGDFICVTALVWWFLVWLLNLGGGVGLWGIGLSWIFW